MTTGSGESVRASSETADEGFATRAVHSGYGRDVRSGPVVSPIYATSTYFQETLGEAQPMQYARPHNPTRHALEKCAASLEGGTAGFAFASGLAAVSAVLESLGADAHIVASDDLFSGTCRLFDVVKQRSSGLSVSYVDMSNVAAIRDSMRDNTRCLWVESPSNPLLKLVDLNAVGAIAHRHGLLAVADNTFASPWIQRPLEAGFDVILHSSTKYLNGHSDVINGIAVTQDSERFPTLSADIRYLQNALGSVASPFDSHLVLRGMKTLPLRMERHCESAAEIAGYLAHHPKIRRTLYPGLASHPQHALASQQMRTPGAEGVARYGGMISAYVDSDFDGVKRFASACKLFRLAQSLGGAESLMEHPATMTHSALSKERLAQLSISDSLLRFSVGLEDVRDLIGDLDQALAHV